jgi:glycosyltransferase involved in cell wall biosynthesis
MDGAAWGGSEELWSAVAQSAVRQGHHAVASVHPNMTDHFKVQQLAKGGVQVLVRPRPPQPECAPPSLPRRAVRRLVRAFHNPAPVSKYDGLAAFGPDLFCISTGHMLDVLWDRDLHDLLTASGKPYCIINQYNDERRMVSLENARRLKAFFGAAGRVFFVSQRNLDVARRQICAEINNGQVVRNPVNLTDPSPVAFPGNGMTRFACVARLDCHYKGQEILIEALSAAKWKERNWQLNLYGTGPDEAYLRELIAFYRLADRVTLKGHATDIRRVWAENHMQLMPSTGEGTPLALVEAMLCGRPAVVTDVGGNAEVIREDETGFIAEAPSVRSFDKALEKAWANQSRWAQMGSAAHHYALTTLMKHDPAAHLLDCLVQAAKGKAAQ